MQDTPFSEMYDVKKKSASGEKTSFFVLIHKIPKQIADAAQTQGVSEAFLENGMPSGILTPSQISHDRMLSVTDAIQDAVAIGVLMALIPLFDFGVWSGTFCALIMLYWFFHVAWWEKGKAWDIKASVKRYLRNTYNFYWAVFIISMSAVAIGMWYMVFSFGVHLIGLQFANSVAEQAGATERAFASIFDTSHLSKEANYAVTLKGEEYQTRFMIVFFIFISITITAKIYFSKLYTREKSVNMQNTEDGLSYTADSALRKLEKAF